MIKRETGVGDDKAVDYRLVMESGVFSGVGVGIGDGTVEFGILGWR